MRGLRFDRLLAGSALALVLAAPIGAAAAPLDDAKIIEAGVPVPVPADVTPPTAADLEPGKKAPASTVAAPAEKPAPPPVYTGKDLVKAPIAASLAATDIPVAEKLRDLLASRAERYFSRKEERSDMEAFYRDRGFAPMWVENNTPSARAKVAMDYLKTVDADGLEPADYAAPEFKAETDALADAELRYTGTILAFARHAQTGRVHYTRISGDILYTLVFPDPAEVLGKLQDAKNVAHSLASYHPPHAGYKALKVKLAEAREQKAAPVQELARIPDGPKFVPGKDDPRVPILRERLKAGDLSNKNYDEGVAEAVKAFQEAAGLTADGIAGPQTLRALNGASAPRINAVEKITATMERWRWITRDLGKAHVMLNIPDFTLKVVNNDKMIWTTRVVTGKPGGMATPILSETMKFITVNPTWNVPPSIVNNEYLPALQQDPDVLERMGLKVTRNAEGNIHIYQPPGPGNALGRIRFNFPNKFLVYQHDTQDKHLFAHDRRAYSHGCMRVQNPEKYAEILLGLSQPNENWTIERIQKMYGNTEQNINLVRQIPVHITYQTAFVDEAGQLQLREDLYGRDAAIMAALKNDERRVADVPMDRPQTVTQVRKDFELPSRYSYYYGGGGSFFDRLFGGGRPVPPAPVNQRRVFTR